MSIGQVLGDHAADVWAVVLVTAGILGALAIYLGSLGPAGHDIRLAAADVVGWGRFLLPLLAVAVGVRLVARRGGRVPRTDPDGWEREPDDRPGHESARAVVGATLGVLVIAGLAGLAGGSPSIRASTSDLGAAGGWVGAAVADPLGHALGGVGAATVLLAVAVVALVVFTGISVRTAAVFVGRSARLGLAVAQGSEDRRAADDESGEDDEPTDPFGRSIDAVAPPADTVDDVDGAVPVTPAGHDAEASGSGPVPGGAGDPSSPPGRPASDTHLDLRLGPTVGEWRLPAADLLKRTRQKRVDEREVDAAGAALVASLAAHGVDTRLVGRTIGPSVTRYEIELGAGVKVSRVTSLSKDIAYAMASPDVRILAPIPGRSAIGVEVPNRHRQLVALGDVLASPEAAKATHPLEVAMGRDIAGRAVFVNLADMPHVLVSGATGAGKSSCINSMLASILVRATPDQVRLILVDPKRVELGQYNDLPHLLTQVVVDPKKAANALGWAVTEMERRYDLLAEVGMRDVAGYNAAFDNGEFVDHEEAHRLRTRGSGDEDDEEERTRFARLPYIVIVVDELNDLMMVAARDVEDSVVRLAQMARAVGIHLVLATQRPSVDVITGVIKANIPSRLAFSVATLADSRVILDQPGAERLIGRGDMLLLSASSSIPQRLQGPWVGGDEIQAVVAHWRRQRPMEVVAGIDPVAGGDGSVRPGEGDGDDDDLLEQAMELVVRSQLGSTSMLQRKLRVGFARAGRLMDLMERRGVVGPSEGSKARVVLMTTEELDTR
jgi:DNA segregation ATPase FtsK/SpoIIIE, S-DNA-T family